MPKPKTPPFLDRPYGRQQGFSAGHGEYSAGKTRKWKQPEELLGRDSNREKEYHDRYFRKAGLPVPQDAKRRGST